MSVECRSIPNASGKYDSSPEETHKQERTRRKTKKEYTAINQGRWNSACGCRSGCGSRSRLELLWGRRGRAGVALFDVLLLDLGSGRHRPTSETTAHFMFPKMSRRDGGKKPKRIKLVRGRDARCSGEFLYNCQRLGTRTGRKSRWHYTFIRRRGFTPATITSLVAPTEAITFDRSPGKFIIYRFFEVSRSPTGDPLRSPPRFHFRSHQAY
jgi:hypothetical protein